MVTSVGDDDDDDEDDRDMDLDGQKRYDLCQTSWKSARDLAPLHIGELIFNQEIEIPVCIPLDDTKRGSASASVLSLERQ